MKHTNWLEPERITAWHPWRRWAARKLDLLFLCYIILSLPYIFVKYVMDNDPWTYFQLSSDDVQEEYDQEVEDDVIDNEVVEEKQGILDYITLNVILTLVASFLSALCNAACMAGFGNTLGKQIVGIKILHRDGRFMTFKEALKREMLVLFRGTALCLPLYPYTYYRAYKNLKRDQITSWDKEMHLKVAYRPKSKWATLGHVRLAIALQIILDLLYLVVCLR